LAPAESHVRSSPAGTPGAPALDGDRQPHFQYWEQSRAIKRDCLTKTELGVTGAETRVPVKEFAAFLQTAGDLLDRNRT
jgi:hypothetical protein